MFNFRPSRVRRATNRPAPRGPLARPTPRRFHAPICPVDVCRMKYAGKVYDHEIGQVVDLHKCPVPGCRQAIRRWNGGQR